MEVGRVIGRIFQLLTSSLFDLYLVLLTPKMLLLVAVDL